MSKDVQALDVLFALQEECFHNLKKAETNFKKTSKDRIKRTYLETRLETLEGLYCNFKENHKSIVSETISDHNYPYFKEDQYERFEENYINYKTLLLDALPSSSTTPPMAGNAIFQQSGQSDMRLPRINLPTFSGKYEEWQTFYDMYTSLIHENKVITPVQKLHYLKSNLSGEAQNLISNFTTTDANYEDAWQQLVRRYDNKRYNCNAVLRTLFSQKKINNESANSIKQLVDTTSTCLKSLKNIGLSTSTWDAIIVFLVVSKLDSDSIRQWEHHLNSINNDELPTWTQLRDYLESRFRSLEMIDTNLMRPPPSAKPVPKPKMFHASIENKPRSNDATCAMCHEKHFIYHCKQYGQLTPTQRQEFVQNNKLCFNCLSPSHSALKCRQPTSCRRCGRRHHTTLHFERENRDTSQVSGPPSSVVPASATSGGHSRDHLSTSRGDTHITTTFSRGAVQPNEKLEAVARHVRRNDKPFGGIQLILCGDFLQLPPVVDRNKADKKFCFQSPCWDKCVEMCFELKEVHRQKDQEFISILNSIRIGRVTKEITDRLVGTARQKIESDGILATILCSHTNDSKTINESKLKDLNGESKVFTSQDSDNSSKILDMQTIAPSKLVLKVGAQVMLLKNINVNAGLVNGARGVVVKFEEGFPVVRFKNKKEYTARTERWYVKNSNGTLLCRRQVPLNLAWAFSIHKSQGLTLDCVEMSLSKIFEAGQAYVALSRAQSLDTLRVLDFDSRHVWADPSVLEFYQRFRRRIQQMEIVPLGRPLSDKTNKKQHLREILKKQLNRR